MTKKRVKVWVNFSYVWKRDKGICRYCTYPADAVDHVIPYSFIPSNTKTNLVLACNKCNGKASNLVFSCFEEKRDYILSRRRTEILRDYERFFPNGHTEYLADAQDHPLEGPWRALGESANPYLTSEGSSAS